MPTFLASKPNAFLSLRGRAGLGQAGSRFANRRGAAPTSTSGRTEQLSSERRLKNWPQAPQGGRSMLHVCSATLIHGDSTDPSIDYRFSPLNGRFVLTR